MLLGGGGEEEEEKEGEEEGKEEEEGREVEIEKTTSSRSNYQVTNGPVNKWTCVYRRGFARITKSQ